MNKDVRFRRNVYIILICVLLLAIGTQLARSKFVLGFNHNSHILNDLKDVRQKHKLLASGTSEHVYDSSRNYCLVFDEMDELSVRIKENTEQVLYYMKQPHTVINMDREELDFSKCQSMLLTASLEHLENDVDTIDEFVHNGGKMFIMRSDQPDDVYNQLYRKLGFINFTYLEGDYGIELTSNVLIGQKGLKFTEDFIYNDVVAGELEDNVLLLAKTNKQVPLMWKKEYGSGAFVVFNGSGLDTKETRGLITGGISMLEPDYIYPIFNAKLFYIDDFPAPLPLGIEPSIYNEYRKDTPTFFRDVWWPQMIQAAKRFDVKYTAVAIQTYQNNVNPPFVRLEDEEMHNLIAFGREVIKSSGEIGIHGYNHQSMQMDKKIAAHFDYKPWDSQADMEASIQAILGYLSKAFPNYNVMSYVPPSNVLGLEGRQALVNAWPTLAVISSLYGVDENNRAYVQEFEIAEDGVIEMPRITSGYFDKNYNIWFEANTITSLGIFSHFIHPDDLLDNDRNHEQQWKDLYKDFEFLLDRLQTTYPWLRSITSTEAAVDVANLLLSDMKVEQDANHVKVNTTSEASNQYFIFRTDKKIGKLENCSVKKIDTNVYLVTAFKNDFSIGLGR